MQAVNESSADAIRDPSWDQYGWIEHTRVLLDSYFHWIGEELIPRWESPVEDARRLYRAPFVVVSHGVEDDPVLSYGNRAALLLWEMDVETLRRTPSRMTAEPIHRDERARLLQRTAAHGFVDDYRGVRISCNGRRFRIERATVWNLLGADGTHVGQAATFAQWHWVDP